MKVEALDESIIHDIGHAFGYYDYGAEHGLIDAYPSRDAHADHATSPTSCPSRSSAPKRSFRWQKGFSAL